MRPGPGSALLLFATTLIVAATGCKRKDDDKTPEEPSGKGGKAVIKATPLHHAELIDSCTIYIKYNTLDLPADGKYDDSAKCVPEGTAPNIKPVASFTQLKKGRYYLFGRGWDPAISQAVEGGVGYTVQDTIGTFAITVPVTEGD